MCGRRPTIADRVLPEPKISRVRREITDEAKLEKAIGTKIEVLQSADHSAAGGHPLAGVDFVG